MNRLKRLVLIGGMVMTLAATACGSSDSGTAASKSEETTSVATQTQP